MSLVHELEKLIHDGLQKLPVCLEEARVLTNNVHDIGRNDGLVILPLLHLGETKKVFDYCDEEPFFGLFV